MMRPPLSRSRHRSRDPFEGAAWSPLTIAAILAVAPGLLGCDPGVPYPQGPIEITGRVVLLPGNEPLSGMGLALMRYSSLGASPVASTRSDADGHFVLNHDVDGRESAWYYVGANTDPQTYDNRYTSNGVYLPSPPVVLDAGSIEVTLNDNP